MDWELFKEHGDKQVKLEDTCPETFDKRITLEGLYQAFRVRLTEE